MKFLELAQKIEALKAEIATVDAQVAAAERAVVDLKTKQAKELSDVESKLSAAKAVYKDKHHTLADMFVEMHKLMGSHPTGDSGPSEGPSPAELKELFLAGQKSRGR